MVHNLVVLPEERSLLDLRNLAYQLRDCVILSEGDVTQLVPVWRVTWLIRLENNTFIRTRRLSCSQEFGRQVLPKIQSLEYHIRARLCRHQNIDCGTTRKGLR